MVIGICIYTYVYSFETFRTFAPEFFAVLLAFITGIGTDRLVEERRNRQERKALLNALRIELEAIKEIAITRRERLYPDEWDSAISSGQLRLLSFQQKKKLAKIFRFITEIDYERRLVKDAEEDYKRAGDLFQRMS